MNRSGLETLSFSKADGRARSPDGALTVVTAHHSKLRLFCPTAQLLFGFTESLKSLAISTVHGVVFDIFA